MQRKKGDDRNQMMMFSLESAIAPDCFIRVLDVFVVGYNIQASSDSKHKLPAEFDTGLVNSLSRFGA
jgi:hypothetical protein